MKKTITAVLALFIIVAFTNQAEAQLEARAGLVLAKIKTSFLGVSASSDTRLGVQLGATYNKAINDKFSFRPGLMYTMKGGSGEDDNGDDGGGTLGYVGVPLDFVYSTQISENTLSFHAGPYIDYLLHASDGAKEFLNSTDFGLNIGAGYDLGQIGFGVNFSTGLSNTSNIEIDDSAGGGFIDFGDISSKNNFTSLYVTYNL